MDKINKKLENHEVRITKLEEFIKGKSLDDKTLLVQCSKCKHQWITRSKALLVSCPNCGNKVKKLTKEQRNEIMQDKIDDKIAREYIKKEEAENKKYPSVWKYSGKPFG